MWVGTSWMEVGSVDIWFESSSDVIVINQKDINLQTKDLINTRNIKFDINSLNPSHQEGNVFYDYNKHVLSYYNENHEVTVNLGQELLIRVRNETGSTILNGSAVYPSGLTINGEILTGLSDDDHIQYLKTDGTRNITGIISYNDSKSFTLDNQLITKKFAEDTHKIYDQLVHSIIENCYYEVTRSGVYITNECWYTNNDKLVKIREINYTRTDGTITQVEHLQYNSLGILSETYTETYSYVDGYINNVVGVLS